MPATLLANAQSPVRRYQEEQLNGLSPIRLLIKLYDIAIVSCDRRDSDRLSRSLVELISALNFEYRDVALPLFRLYNHCLRQGKAGNFAEVRAILSELRETWEKAAVRLEANGSNAVDAQQ